MPDAGAEVFRSPRRVECDERAFVLAAVGIPSEIVAQGADHLLQVAPAERSSALVHLHQYDLEMQQRAAAPLPAPPRMHSGAWIGSVAYAVVLLAVAYAVSNGLWRLDAFDAGELDATRVQDGQWWRVWTALTLHLDGPHLAANTAAGVWFSYLAGRLIGAGNTWLLVVLGAGAANWLEAHFSPPGYRSAGASTAVFTTLGLLSAYSWSTRFRLAQRWASRWGPLIAGIILLGWTGTGGGEVTGPRGMDGTEVDVVAHALGFTIGLLLGVGAAWRPLTGALDRSSQWLAGLAALAVMAWSWMRALGS
ncbi:MAG TPA: rhomboid family intramembrane serine protease [Steroidobacteraceae bacterium]|jgi:membrane associated rhomboid family serine protease